MEATSFALAPPVSPFPVSYGSPPGAICFIPGGNVCGPSCRDGNLHTRGRDRLVLGCGSSAARRTTGRIENSRAARGPARRAAAVPFDTGADTHRSRTELLRTCETCDRRGRRGGTGCAGSEREFVR